MEKEMNEMIVKHKKDMLESNKYARIEIIACNAVSEEHAPICETSYVHCILEDVMDLIIAMDNIKAVLMKEHPILKVLSEIITVNEVQSIKVNKKGE